MRSELLAALASHPETFAESLPARWAAFRREHRALLKAHDFCLLQRLPKEAIPGLEAMADDGRVTAPIAAQIAAILRGAESSVDSVKRSDPTRTFISMREAIEAALVSPGDRSRNRDDILEMLAPPRIVRLNDDLNHPILAMPKPADIFVVWFDRDAKTDSFLPRRIRWARRESPALPNADAKTADEALATFAAALETSEPAEPATPDNFPPPSFDQVTALRKQWLDPHSARLSDRGAYQYQRLPQAPLPDFRDWKEQEGQWDLLLDTSKFPQTRWDPLSAFLFQRDRIIGQTRSTANASCLALIDRLVPPTVYRASSDANEPVLFTEEGGSCVVVAFSSSVEGYTPTRVGYFLRQ